MENDKMAENAHKALCFRQIINVALMIFFTIVAAVCFRLFLDSFNSHNWFGLAIFGFGCVVNVRFVIKSFQFFRIMGAQRTILKTKGLEALKEHLRKEDGKQ